MDGEANDALNLSDGKLIDTEGEVKVVGKPYKSLLFSGG
jgi:hypothetical protein